jgi:hypothetical protein
MVKLQELKCYDLLKSIVAYTHLSIQQYLLKEVKKMLQVYSGEGGWYLNKASYTYYINRRGKNENEFSVDNVRNKQTGGNTTDIENPVVIYWHPTKIDIGYRMGDTELDVIGQVKRKYNPLNETFKPKKEFQEDKETDAKYEP